MHSSTSDTSAPKMGRSTNMKPRSPKLVFDDDATVGLFGTGACRRAVVCDAVRLRHVS